MTEIASKRDMELEELIERTKESFRDIVEGNALSDEKAIRERIEEHRQSY